MASFRPTISQIAPYHSSTHHCQWSTSYKVEPGGWGGGGGGAGDNYTIIAKHQQHIHTSGAIHFTGSFPPLVDGV